MYTLSKKVRHGSLVKLRGNKFVLCGKNGKPSGVYQFGSTRTTITLDGERIVTRFPTGIVTQGQAESIMAKEQ